MKLLLDIGNSTLKWAYVSGDALEETGEFVHRNLDRDRAAAFVDELPRPVTEVFAANVAGSDFADAIANAFLERFGVTVGFARTAARFGSLVCAYDDPSQLGVDRWAALVGASAAHEGALCIVDAGTAVTIDILQSDGRHAGGLIVPGLRLMRESLYRDTGDLERLSSVEAADETAAAELGRDTASAIRLGTIAALCALIDSCMTELSGQSESATLVVTGGDAGIIMSGLKHRPDHRPLLVLEGLKRLSS